MENEMLENKKENSIKKRENLKRNIKAMANQEQGITLVALVITIIIIIILATVTINMAFRR